MASIAEIIEHPKTSLRGNALWPSGQLNVPAKGKPSVFNVGTAQEGSHVWPVTLRPLAGVECKKSGATALPCWEIAPAGMSYDVLAYYLPWMPNSTHDMLLGDKADFFITDTMNRCSFAYGPGGAPRVAHINYNTANDEGMRIEGNPIDQPFMDNEIARLLPGIAVGTLRKADYATGNFPNVTVIGMRRGGVWTFVYQKRDYVGARGAVRACRFKSVHTVH